jgi:hypothetical protein
VTAIRSFVVRIYRHGRSGLDGVVEDVRTGRSRPFHSITERWDALRAPQRTAPRREDTPPTPPTTD